MFFKNAAFQKTLIISVSPIYSILFPSIIPLFSCVFTCPFNYSQMIMKDGVIKKFYQYNLFARFSFQLWLIVFNNLTINYPSQEKLYLNP